MHKGSIEMNTFTKIKKPQSSVCIFNYSGIINCEIVKIKGARTRRFAFKTNNKVFAYFDTEEKARMYADAFEKGLDIGYSEGYERFAK